jgi:hypothetical protein
VTRENTILSSWTQSERIKLWLSLQDHGDPIVIINRSDNLTKCVFSPFRRNSVASEECRVRAFREMSSFCQGDTLATIHCAILFIDGRVVRKEYLSVWNKFWYFCDVKVVYTHNCSSNIISASTHKYWNIVESNLAPPQRIPKTLLFRRYVKQPSSFTLTP